jgi:hypothetical protein
VILYYRLVGIVFNEGEGHFVVCIPDRGGAAERNRKWILLDDGEVSLLLGVCQSRAFPHAHLHEGTRGVVCVVRNQRTLLAVACVQDPVDMNIRDVLSIAVWRQRAWVPVLVQYERAEHAGEGAALRVAAGVGRSLERHERHRHMPSWMSVRMAMHSSCFISQILIRERGVLADIARVAVASAADPTRTVLIATATANICGSRCWRRHCI